MIVRIIPRLDVKGPNLVKGIHLEGLRVLGPPDAYAREYYAQGADELLFMDIVASLYQRNSLLDVIERTSREVFIPLTVGGGLRSLDDIRAALLAGADKVAINTMAIKQPHFIREAAQRFGSSTIVLSIEAKRRPDGTYEAYTDNGRERTGRDVIAWAKEAVELGCGEVLVTSVDHEGTGKGLDLELLAQLGRAVPVPVIGSGGIATPDHVVDGFKKGCVQAIGIASILHYEAVARLSPTHNKTFSRIKPTPLPRLKAHLAAAGISIRPSPSLTGAGP